MEFEAMPRQLPGDLRMALTVAVRLMRWQEHEYRNQSGPKHAKMSKEVRRTMAAEYADWARVIEGHIARLAPSPTTDTGSE